MTNERTQAGLAVRRDVLGADYVERSMANANDFTRPFQDLLNDYCWGQIWTRPGLDRRTRSLLNLAMLTALNRPNEFRLHMRGALNNGCTTQEIQEVLLQAAIYCGMPAALQSVGIAREVLDEAAHG